MHYNKQCLLAHLIQKDFIFLLYIQESISHNISFQYLTIKSINNCFWFMELVNNTIKNSSSSIITAILQVCKEQCVKIIVLLGVTSKWFGNTDTKFLCVLSTQQYSSLPFLSIDKRQYGIEPWEEFYSNIVKNRGPGICFLNSIKIMQQKNGILEVFLFLTVSKILISQSIIIDRIFN